MKNGKNSKKAERIEVTMPHVSRAIRSGSFAQFANAIESCYPMYKLDATTEKELLLKGTPEMVEYYARCASIHNENMNLFREKYSYL